MQLSELTLFSCRFGSGVRLEKLDVSSSSMGASGGGAWMVVEIWMVGCFDCLLGLRQQLPIPN